MLKTSEESVEHHYIQPIKDGTFQFDPETFPRLRPEMITRDFFEKSGLFTEPICIPAEWNPRPWAEGTGKSMDVDEAVSVTAGETLTWQQQQQQQQQQLDFGGLTSGRMSGFYFHEHSEP